MRGVSVAAWRSVGSGREVLSSLLLTAETRCQRRQGGSCSGHMKWPCGPDLAHGFCV